MTQKKTKVTKVTKLENCFIDENINFNYSIEDKNGTWIADVHALTPKDMSYIKSKSFNTKIVDGSPEVDIDYFLYNIALITTSVDKWVFDREITFSNVNLLNAEYRELIANKILATDEIFTKNQDAIKSN